MSFKEKFLGFAVPVYADSENHPLVFYDEVKDADNSHHSKRMIPIELPSSTCLRSEAKQIVCNPLIFMIQIIYFSERKISKYRRN